MGVRDDKLKHSLEQARQCLRRGDFAAAHKLADTVRQQLESSAEPGPLYASALLNCGIINQFLGNMGESERLLEQAALLYGELNHPDKAILCDSYRSRCIAEYGDLPRAHHVAGVALEKARALGLPDMEARLLSSLCLINVKLDKLGEATANINAAIKLFDELGDEESLRHSIIQLANLYTIGDQPEHSRRIFEEALLKAREQCDQSYEAWLLLNLGQVCYRLHDFECARDCYRQAIQLSRKDGQAQVHSHAHHGCGLVELRTGNRLKARNQLLRALHLASSGAFAIVENLSLIYLGVCDLYDLNVEDALNRFMIVRRRFNGGNQLERGIVDIYLAIAHLLHGDIDHAEIIFAARSPIDTAGVFLDDSQIRLDLVQYLLEEAETGRFPLDGVQSVRLRDWATALQAGAPPHRTAEQA